MKRIYQKAIALSMSFLMVFSALPNLSSTDKAPSKKNTDSYGRRLKESDLKGLKVHDFISKNEDGTYVYHSEKDPYSKQKPKQLAGSNWYQAGNLSHVYEQNYYFNGPTPEPTATPTPSAKSSNTPRPERTITPGQKIALPEEDAQKNVESVDENSLEEETIEDSEDYSYDEPDEEPEEAPVSAPRTDSDEGDYSRTTVQESEVDEADIIKTDGKNIYYLSYEKGIAIVQGGKDAKQLSYIRPGRKKSGKQPAYSDLYLSDDNLIVMAYAERDYYDDDSEEYLGYSENNYNSIFYVYDISNPQKPKETRRVEVNGQVNTTRFYNGSLYFVINNSLETSYSMNPAGLNLFAYKDTSLGSETYYISPEQMYFSTLDTDSHYYGSYYNRVCNIIGSFSVRNNKAIEPKAYFGYLSDVYMNQNNLYLTMIDPVSGDLITEEGEDIKPKKGMTYTASAKSDFNVGTFIHRFALQNGQASFEAMGSVPGSVLNQYSMSEYKSNFRIATTTSWQNRQSGVYILDAKTMKRIGKLEGLAPGEEIKSARFSGDRVNLVTYLATDPLFVIDLQNPKKPTLLGELKIPGFSTYLHPYTDKYLIGVGWDDANQIGRNSDGGEFVYGTIRSGIKLSLFDISNPLKPKEVSKTVLGGPGTYSEAIEDPKAIMFDMKQGIMAFPISYDMDTLENGKIIENSWDGGVVIGFSRKGFKVLKELDNLPYNSDYSSRFVYIGDYLYYINDLNLVVIDYKSLKTLKTIDLYYGK